MKGKQSSLPAPCEQQPVSSPPLRRAERDQGDSFSRRIHFKVREFMQEATVGAREILAYDGLVENNTCIVATARKRMNMHSIHRESLGASCDLKEGATDSPRLRRVISDANARDTRIQGLETRPKKKLGTIRNHGSLIWRTVSSRGIRTTITSSGDFDRMQTRRLHGILTTRNEIQKSLSQEKWNNNFYSRENSWIYV